MGILRGLHLVGMVFWFGSQLFTTRLLRVHATAPEAAREPLARLARRTQLGFGLPGLLVSVGSGLWMLLRIPQTYMSLGWIHVMLTGALVAIVLEVVIFVLVGKAQRGVVAGPLPMIVHGVSSLVLIVVVLFAGIGRYGS